MALKVQIGLVGNFWTIVLQIPSDTLTLSSTIICAFVTVRPDSYILQSDLRNICIVTVFTTVSCSMFNTHLVQTEVLSTNKTSRKLVCL